MPNADCDEEINFQKGVALAKIPDGKTLSDTFEGQQVLFVRRDEKFLAVDAHCTHYGGELSKRLIVHDTVCEATAASRAICSSISTGVRIACSSGVNALMIVLNYPIEGEKRHQPLWRSSAHLEPSY